MKKSLLVLSVVVLSGSGTLSCSPRAAPPSLLLITVDTLRADRVGVYGSSLGLTPAIDRLAARGAWFEQAVSPVPLTLPAHATILSGLEPLHHGIHNNGTFVFPADRATLATELKARGHATGAFVAAVVLDRRFGLARGFDVYDDQIGRVLDGRSVLESERSCAVVSANAIAWVRTQSGPFFAWVHMYEPHAPYTPPEDLTRLHPGRPYDAEVAAADRCVAGLLDAVEAARPGGVVTALASDHGEGLGDHGEATHGLFLYQSTLAVPMIVAGPGVPAWKGRAGLSRLADLAPTLLKLVGSRPLAGVDGRDLFSGPAAREAYAESDYATGFGWAGLRSWRVGDLKLIQASKAQLFDLARDPLEGRDLAAERPADVERLGGVLRLALASQIKNNLRRPDAATEERLRSLGYVSSPSREPSARGTPVLDPLDALPLLQAFERAMAAETRGDLAASIVELRSLIRQDPENLLFLRSLASALRRSGRSDEAMGALGRALLLAPRDAALSHDLAVALGERGRLGEAVEAEERALAIDPEFVDALEHLATLRAQAGDFGAARVAVERALAIDTNNARAWSNRGNIDRAQGHTAQAAVSYRRATDLDPNLADALNGLGVLAVEGGRLDAAADLFEKALTSDPDLDEARLNLAVVEARRGRVGLAGELASRAAAGAVDPEVRARARAFLADLRGSQ